MADQPNSEDKDTVTTPSESYLDKIVGEDKKYKSAEELAKAYLHADSFIDHMKKETAELRTELDKSVKLEELLNQNQPKEQEPTNPEAPVAETAPTTPAEPATDSAVEGQDLGAEIRRVLEEEDRKRKTETNLENVAQLLVQTYGDEAKARDVVMAKANDLGVDSQYLLDVAARSPRAFYELVGLKSEVTKPSGSPRADVNTSAFEAQRPNHTSGPKEGTYAYYENLRKTDRKAYFSPKIQQEMMRLATEKGPDFYKS